MHWVGVISNPKKRVTTRESEKGESGGEKKGMTYSLNLFLHVQDRAISRWFHPSQAVVSERRSGPFKLLRVVLCSPVFFL